MLASVLLVAGCGSDADKPAPETTGMPAAVAAAPATDPVVESSYGTPIKGRVATLGFLNKRNNLTQDIVLKAGEARRIGNVVIRMATCERSLPWEQPAEEGAFVQVYVEERPNAQTPLQWRKVFSGWMFRNSPSLNVVEHPIYDVWLKSCAMRFPGEDEEASASASSAAKASGRGTARSRNDSPAAAAPPAVPAAPVDGAAPDAPPPGTREEDGAD